MNKKSIFFFLSFLVLMSFVSFVQSATDITTIPDGMTVDQFKQAILDANHADNFFLSVTGQSYWGICEKNCADIIFGGDCNPCASGETASSCMWNPDSMSTANYFSSATSYCNQLFKTYNYYNKQCFCQVPNVQCSGGANVGDRKCSGNTVMQCQSGGVWNVVDNCQYTCSGGSCQAQQCQPQTTKQCSGNAVYWYDSCGTKGAVATQCSSSEVCQGSSCVRVCTAGFVGQTSCSGNSVQQQYQNIDCSTETKTVQTCSGSTQCTNGACVALQCPTCPEPSQWSQCANGKVARTSYVCDATTNYQCQSKQETQNCGCTTNTDCNTDEKCDSTSFTCQKLVCKTGEIAQNNQCLSLGTSTQTIIIIAVAGVILLAIIVVVLVLVFRKGGKKRR